jgi:predicted unusual protein kinase regulating ubiquinone biosynthesis (AarF/ABC1/UbiB family)
VARARLRRLASRLLGRQQEEQLLEYAEILVHYLGEMKGLVMKIGQMMSYYGFDLPPEIVEVLRPLQDASPPVSPDRILGVIQQELGRPVSELFTAYDPRPFATGSIGQVHVAELPGGPQVAVKVQYPGIERSVRNDLRGLSLVAPVLRRVLPRWDIDGILHEVATQALEECDYLKEAAHQRYFHRLFASDPDIEIPSPFSTHCSRRILTAELVDGVPFEEFCRGASQADRDRAGELLSRFVLRCMMSERYFNTDIHPGNLLFRGSRLFVVDFGNVRRWTGKQGVGFRMMLEAIITGDLERFHQAFVMVGFVSPEDRLDVQEAFDLIASRLLRCVTEDRPMRFDRAAVRRDIELWFVKNPEARKAVLPPPYLLALRAYWGNFAILAELEAEANWYRVARDVLSEFPLRLSQP